MNTIFGDKTAAVAPKIFNQSTNQLDNRKPRKKRSDAKHDIKFRLSIADKKALKSAAMNHGLSLTAFASMILKNELTGLKEYDSYSYDNTGRFVHVMLENDFFEIVKRLSVDWDMPYRKVVHRIIKEYIWRSTGVIKITSYK